MTHSKPVPPLNLPDMPQRIASLPQQDGYPIPWFVARTGGDRVDFRIADEKRLLEAIKKKKCWVCGQPLGVHKVFALGPMCCINRTSAEPPMHRDCAEWSVKACPFLLQRQSQRRTDDLDPNSKEPPGNMIDRQPGVTALWITKSFTPYQVGSGLLFEIGDPTEVHFWRQGRTATYAEIKESLHSGLPELARVAAQQGPQAQIKLLEMTTAFVENIMPAEPQESA